MTETALEVLEAKIRPEDLPEAVGWRVLIEPIEVEEKTKGGLFLPEEAKKAKEYLRYIGRVVTMGPLCYKHAKFEGGEPWCQVGDWVAYGQYAGQEVVVRTEDGSRVKLKIVNDDEILSKIPNPEAVLIYE